MYISFELIFTKCLPTKCHGHSSNYLLLLVSEWTSSEHFTWPQCNCLHSIQELHEHIFHIFRNLITYIATDWPSNLRYLSFYLIIVDCEKWKSMSFEMATSGMKLSQHIVEICQMGQYLKGSKNLTGVMIS